MELTKQQANVLRGMFSSRSYCLGYDRDTPLGELADSARRHWDYIEREFNKRDNRIESMSAQVAILKYRASGLYEENQRMADRFFRKELHHKYKRCLGNAAWCKLQDDNFFKIHNIDPMKMGCGRAKRTFYRKWHKRWLELADYFKSKASYG